MPLLAATEMPTYLMEDPREASRLESKVESRAWAARYLGEHLYPGAAALELGCGPGHLMRGAAEVEPEIFGSGVDASEMRIAEARRRTTNPRLEFLVGDSQQLPLPDDTYDVAWTRHMLEYVPRKQQVVDELYRVVRPGGTVLLQDLDGQFLWHDPIDERLSRSIDRVMATLARAGFDPLVGRKLYRMMLTAGFRDVRVTVEPYHLYAGAIDAVSLSQWKVKLDILRLQLVQILGSSEADEMIRSFLDHLRNPTTLTYSVLFTVIGRK